MYSENPNFITRLLYILLVAIARIRGHNFYSGPYSNWIQAQQKSSGYNNEYILNQAVVAQNEVLAGNAIYERDTKLFYKEQHNPHLLRALELASAVEKKVPLNIIDFGGAFGSGFFQHRKPLQNYQPFSWNVIEQKIFVDKGQQLYQNQELKFYENIEEVEAYATAQLFILSSVLQYIEQPLTLLEKIVAIGPDFIFIDRTPFITQGKSLITVQHVPAAIYKASYPSWLFSENDIMGSLSEHYLLVSSFEALDGRLRSGPFHINHRGFILARKS